LPDVIVVGGGVMGASAAFWLTRMDPALKVLLVEPDPTYARAATALSVASIRSQFSSPVNVKISRFGIDFIRNFSDWTGPAGAVPDLGLKEQGYLFVTSRGEAAATMHELAAMQRDLGAATEVLAPAALSRRFPWLATDDLVAGSFGPRDEGWFDNMGFLWGLRRAAIAQGAEVRRDRVTALRAQRGRVQGVTLAGGGAVDAPAVVLAAGTQVNALLATLALSVPVEPRKRTVFIIDAPNLRQPDAPLLIDAGFYIRPEGAQWLTATVPHDDHACDINDFEPDLQLFEEVIWEQLYHRAPGFDAVKVVRHWVGHYDFNTLDQNAILGPHPAAAGLHLMTGFSGHGLQQAPAAGRAIAEHILHNGWRTIDMDALSFQRIVQGRPLIERAVV
jgi:FAD-dependent oxidoreductase domain-containing protein 1